MIFGKILSPLRPPAPATAPNAPNALFRALLAEAIGTGLIAPWRSALGRK